MCAQARHLGYALWCTHEQGAGKAVFECKLLQVAKQGTSMSSSH